MINITDNFLPQKDFKQIKDIMESKIFPWYFNPFITDTSEISNLDLYQFTHIIFNGREGPSSEGYQLIKPIIEKLNVKAICRIKANLLVKTEKIIEHAFHTDFFNNRTAIYYVNTNNGYTKFSNGKKIESIANRLVEFDSNMSHTGSTSTDNKCRIVININYYPLTRGECK